MNTNKFYYELMKLNVLSSSYVDDSYKAAWHGNVYSFFFMIANMSFIMRLQSTLIEQMKRLSINYALY